MLQELLSMGCDLIGQVTGEDREPHFYLMNERIVASFAPYAWGLGAEKSTAISFRTLPT